MSLFTDNKDFYPTPEKVFNIMIKNEIIAGKIIYDPSCGSGNIIDFALQHGASQVLGSEIDPRLREISGPKCRMIGDDFLKVKSEQISHVDFIIMNPPFSADEAHILHAIDIAPANCRIIALCNWNSIRPRRYKESERTQKQEELNKTISRYNGKIENLEDCFSYAERKTYVNIGMIKLTKTGEKETEFEGFFMEEEPEEIQNSGIVKHNFVRDVVNRYVAAVKKFEDISRAGHEINQLVGYFFRGSFGFSCHSYDSKIETTMSKLEFKKELQKQAWRHVFKKLDMTEYLTEKLKDDLNKFVEKQQQYPFTMKNIYQMIRVVILTHESRMDNALVECFDSVTKYHHENRYGVEGWKTNDVYLLGKKFIIPNMCPKEKYNDGNKISTLWGRNFNIIEDFLRGLCYITKSNYNRILDLDRFLRHEIIIETNDGGFEIFKDYEETKYQSATKKFRELQEEGKNPVMKKEEKVYGKFYDWSFFKIKVFQKGTVHFEFKDEEVWALFNSHIARIKGFALPETIKRGAKKQKEYEKQQKKVNEEMGDFTLTKKRNSFNPEPAITPEPEPQPKETPKPENNQKPETKTQTKTDEDMKKIKDLDIPTAINNFEEEGRILAQVRKEQEALLIEAKTILETPSPKEEEESKSQESQTKIEIDWSPREKTVKKPLGLTEIIFEF